MPAPDLVPPKYVKIEEPSSAQRPLVAKTSLPDVSCNHTAVGSDSA